MGRKHSIDKYKLTEAQVTMLVMALSAKRSLGWVSWFVPSRYELTDIFGTSATAKALCGMGLLEYEVLWHGRRGNPDALQFRFTNEGMRIAEIVADRINHRY